MTFTGGIPLNLTRIHATQCERQDMDVCVRVCVYVCMCVRGGFLLVIVY